MDATTKLRELLIGGLLDVLLALGGCLNKVVVGFDCSLYPLVLLSTSDRAATTGNHPATD